MGFYIDQSGRYYEGDKASDADSLVPQRPSYIHDWNGATWVVNAARQAAATQALQDIQDASDAKAYAKLKALSQMTPAQVQGWVTTNVTNLAQAQDAIATLAIAVSVLIRRL